MISMSSINSHHAEQVQRRRILAQLGVTLWASRDSATLKLPAAADSWRKTADRISDTAVAHSVFAVVHPSADDSTETLQAQPEKADIKADISDLNPALAALINKKTVQSVDNEKVAVDLLVDAPVEQQDTPVMPDIRYHLQGVRFHAYVLIVDMAMLTPATESVWLSLVAALDKQAKNRTKSQAKTLLRREIRFPVAAVSDGLAGQMDIFELARTTFFGYVFGLSRGEQVALISLTPLPAVVQASGFNQGDFSWVTGNVLEQMLMDGTLKKKLWQLMMS